MSVGGKSLLGSYRSRIPSTLLWLSYLITNLFPDACKECVKTVGNVLFVVGFNISYHKYLVLFIMIWLSV